MFLPLRKTSSEPLFLFTNAKMSVQCWGHDCCRNQSHLPNVFYGFDVSKGQFAALPSCLQKTGGYWTCRKHFGRELCQMDAQRIRQGARAKPLRCRLEWAAFIASGAQFGPQHTFFLTLSPFPREVTNSGNSSGNTGCSDCWFMFGRSRVHTSLATPTPPAWSTPRRPLSRSDPCFVSAQEKKDGVFFFYFLTPKLYWSMSG